MYREVLNVTNTGQECERNFRTTGTKLPTKTIVQEVLTEVATSLYERHTVITSPIPKLIGLFFTVAMTQCDSCLD